MRHPLLGALSVLAAMTLACGQSGSDTPTAPTSVATTVAVTTTTPTTTTTTTTSGIEAMYAQFVNGVEVAIGATTVTLRTTNVPDHTSPYFGVGHAKYVAPHSGMLLNPNSIGEQNVTLNVPAAPVVGDASDTPMSAIGMAVNGVVFFNQYAAGRQPLTSEIESFDLQHGHPDPASMYHYHLEPVWLTRASTSSLVGVLLDGFPVYGPTDADGTTPADLDVCHGHVGTTVEFPDGLYHYHTTDEAPYISGCFRGASGTVG